MLGSPTATPPESRPRKGARWPYLALGCASVALGYVGIIVPGLPTTVFFIVAVWAFKRSSPRLESWMLDHPVFGQTLRDWEETKSMTKRAKTIAIATLWAGIGFSLYFLQKPTVQAILITVAVAVTWYLATRKTKPEPAD